MSIPAKSASRQVLNNVGEDVSLDDVHNMSDAEHDDGDDDVDNSSEKSDEDDATAVAEDDDTAIADGHDVTAVAADDVAAVAVDDSCEHIVSLSLSQADKVHHTDVYIAALQSSIESIKQTGQLRMVQCMEAEISKLRRREQILASEAPAVAETFRRYRLAEDEEFRQKQLMIKQMNRRKKDPLDAIAAKDAAAADLNKHETRHTGH